MISNTDAIRAGIEEMFEAGRRDEGFSEVRNKHKHLSSYGPEIVDVILDELAQRKLSGNIQYNDQYTVSHLVSCLCKYAENRHASKIASLFYWDEIASDGNDRSIRYYLLNTLKRIGSPAEIQILEEFTELVKSAEYSTEDFYGISYWDGGGGYQGYSYSEKGHEKVLGFRQLDQHDIRETINAIKARVS